MKLILFNLKMILNKITVILLSVTMLLLVIVSLLEYMNLDVKESNNVNIYIYFQNTFFYSKLIIAFITIYLFSNSISKKGDFIHYTLRMFNYNRCSILISKIIACSLITLFLSVFSFIAFLSVGLLIDGFRLNMDYLVAFSNIFLASIVFGTISLLLMQLINNYFVIIVICVLFLLVSGIENNNIFVNIIVFIIPKVDEYGFTQYGSLHLLWLYITYSVLSYFVYQNRDLNY